MKNLSQLRYTNLVGNCYQTKQSAALKLRTHIAYGSPNMQDTSAAHGSPLGDEEIKLIKEKFGWDPEKKFHVPDEVKAHTESALVLSRRRQ